jgi:prolyl oligopeptidase
LAAAGVAVAETDSDPYLWLADIHGAKAIAWAEAQTAKSNALLKADPTYKQDYDILLKALNTNDRIPQVELHRADAYNFWQDASHVRGIWRRTTIADYAKPEPNWDTLLDVDKLDAAENTQWVWQGADCAPKSTRCLIQLSPGGGDAATIREFDRKTKSFIRGGFTLPVAKLQAAYVDADHVLFATDFGPGTMTKSSYARIVKLWTRGQKIADAKTVYEATVDDIAARPAVFHGPYGTIALIDRNLTTFTSEFYFLLPGGGTMKLPLPPGANIAGVTNGNLIFTLRDAWTPPGQTEAFPQGSLIAFPVKPFALQKMLPSFTLLFTPDEHGAIDSVGAGRDAVYASIYEDVTGSVHAFRPTPDGTSSDTKLDLPAGGSTTVVATNNEGPEAQFTYESFLTPPTLYQTDGTKVAAIKSQKPLFDASNLAADQFWATSNDGTKVPYFLIHPKNAKGPIPTILYSYGGFELSLTPWYWNDGHRPLYAGDTWLNKGGAIAVANIRGGGEFGPRWHQAALKENRQKAFDDFASVAKDLEARGLTTPAQLGIVGASNGGVLTTVTMTQHPELLRAVVSQRPLVDMLRYTHYGAGASWIEEYGDPDKPADRAYIEKYSAYQNVKPDVKYPSILFITETTDDRVTPIWARMMAAKMEAQGHDVLFNESEEGGHGPGSTNTAQAEMWALSYTYLGRELGLK